MEFNSLSLSLSYPSSYSKVPLTQEMEFDNEVQIQTKNLLGRLEKREFDENGIDLTLSLRPPQIRRQCSECKRYWTPQWRLWQNMTLCNACGLQARKKERQQQECHGSLSLGVGSLKKCK